MIGPGHCRPQASRVILTTFLGVESFKLTLLISGEFKKASSLDCFSIATEYVLYPPLRFLTFLNPSCVNIRLAK